jgi:hypothetical protein
MNNPKKIKYRDQAHILHARTQAMSTLTHKDKKLS